MENSKEDRYQEIDLLDYLLVIVRRWKTIVRNVIITVFVVAVISFLLPNSYTARTTILPPDETNSAGLLSAFSNSPLSNMLLTETSTTSDLFVEILKSRSVLDGVLQDKYIVSKRSTSADSLTLLEIFDLESLEKARKKLFKNVSVTASAEGIVQIDVELHNPQLAADVANGFVSHLDEVNKNKTSSKAKNSRIYIENQLKLTEDKLTTASEKLATFQEKYKAVSLEEQTKAAIEEAGVIKGNIIAKEVEIGVAEQMMKQDNVIIIKLRKELEELQKQYNYLQYGNDESLENKKEFYIPFADVPSVGLELANLLRDVKVQETVWQLLNQQFYQAKIQEARDTPTIQILDEAVPPEMRSKPKRKLLILIGSFLALLFSMFFVFAAEFLERLKTDKSSSGKMEEMLGKIQKDWQEIKNSLGSFIRRSK
jgi:tyrosine-protein kinase Etk/Wzc